MFLAGCAGTVVLAPMVLVTPFAAAGGAFATVTLFTTVLTGWAIIGVISICSGAVIKFAHN